MINELDDLTNMFAKGKKPVQVTRDGKTFMQMREEAKPEQKKEHKDELRRNKEYVIHANLPGQDEKLILQALGTGNDIEDLEELLEGRISHKGKGVIRKMVYSREMHLADKKKSNEAQQFLDFAKQKGVDIDSDILNLDDKVWRKLVEEFGNEPERSEVVDLARNQADSKKLLTWEQVNQDLSKFGLPAKRIADLLQALPKNARTNFSWENLNEGLLKIGISNPIIAVIRSRLRPGSSEVDIPTYKPGDKVKDQYGEKLTVDRQFGSTVFTKEKQHPIHATKIFPVKG